MRSGFTQRNHRELTRELIPELTHVLTNELTRELTHELPRSLTRSLARSLTRSFTSLHSLTEERTPIRYSRIGGLNFLPQHALWSPSDPSYHPREHGTGLTLFCYCE